MIRLYFYVEGRTEQEYVDSVLKDHLAPFEVYVMGAILVSHGQRGGVVHRGGGGRYAPVKRDLLNLLKRHRQPEVRFTSMLDLYALATDFPGRPDADRLRHLPRDRVEALETAFAADIGDGRFLPHVQLHEFETILLCDPGAFATEYLTHDKEIEQLRQLVSAFGSPEEIDDGPNTAPSKRIEALFPGYPRQKATVGVTIASLIPLATVRQCCLHFDAWITRLENLGAATEQE